MQLSSPKRTVTKGYVYASTQIISTIGNLIHFPLYSPALWAYTTSQGPVLSHQTMD